MPEYVTDLTEFNKLEAWLRENGIEYRRKDDMHRLPYCIDQFDPELKGYGEFHRIEVFQNGRYAWDVICHWGSYGYEMGLLEWWDSGEGQPIGWLTADEVIEKFLKEAD